MSISTSAEFVMVSFKYLNSSFINPKHSKPFFLYVGSRKRYKNFTLLVKAFSEIKKQLTSRDYDKIDQAISKLISLNLDELFETLLDEKDAADLARIEGLLHWSHMKSEIDQQFVKTTLASIESIDNQFIKDIVLWRLDVRIILAALRIRQKGLKQPPDKKILGFDSWHFYISNYWNEADFGLGKQCPWLIEANDYLLANQSLKLEKQLIILINLP